MHSARGELSLSNAWLTAPSTQLADNAPGGSAASGGGGATGRGGGRAPGGGLRFAPAPACRGPLLEPPLAAFAAAAAALAPAGCALAAARGFGACGARGARCASPAAAAPGGAAGFLRAAGFGAVGAAGVAAPSPGAASAAERGCTGAARPSAVLQMRRRASAAVRASRLDKHAARGAHGMRHEPALLHACAARSAQSSARPQKGRRKAVHGAAARAATATQLSTPICLRTVSWRGA